MMQTADEVETFRRLSKELKPIPTAVAPRLARLPEIRCVLFDIYGTLVVSGSGDVGTAKETAQTSALREALAAVGLRDLDASETLARYFAAIQKEHAARLSEGVDFPEVEISEIWKTVLDSLNVRNTDELCRRLAIEYECRANPSWPMPDAAATLDWLIKGRIILGMISNAQWFTKSMIAALFGCDYKDMGFDPACCFFSYEHRVAKPSTYLFQLADQQLRSMGVTSSSVLYVGNDMLNDVYAASQVGFRTALFAGDQRSLRLREQDPRCSNLQPDVVLTQLAQLQQCLRD